MSNQPKEFGAIVTFENPQQSDLIKSGLTVVHQSNQIHQLVQSKVTVLFALQENKNAELIESGLLILHDAQDPTPEARLLESGLMILHSTPSLSLENQKLQSSTIKFFPQRQAAQLKKYI